MKKLPHQNNERTILPTSFGDHINKVSIANLIRLWGGSAANIIAAFLTQLILARVLGPREYGALASSIAVASALALIISFGVPQYWLRIFGKKGSSAYSHVRISINILALNITVTALLVGALSLLEYKDSRASELTAILLIHSLGLAAIELAAAKYQLEENYHAISLWQVFPATMRLLGIITLTAVVQGYLNAYSVAVMYAVVALPTISFALIEVAKLVKGNMTLAGHSNTKENKEVALPHETRVTMAHVMREAFPLGVFGVLNFIYFQSDVVLISYLSTAEAAGQYSVAYSIMVAIYIIPTVFYQKYLLPKLHRWLNHDVEKLLFAIKAGNKAMLAIGVAIAFILLMLSDFILPLVFGEKYQYAATVLEVLAFAIPFQFLISGFSATLLTHKETKIKIYCLTAACSIKAIASVLLIPELSAIGAAVSTLLSSIALLVLYYFFHRKIYITHGNDSSNKRMLFR